MAYTTTYFACSYNVVKRLPIVLATVDQMDEDTLFTDCIGYNVVTDKWVTMPLEGIRATALAYGQRDAASIMYVVGDRGEIWTRTQGKLKREQLPDSGLEGRCLGQPNDIRMIASHPYVCGFAGQVYRLADDRWVHMDDGLAEPEGKPDSIDLESIDGIGPDNIYVVGSGGLVAHWNGRAWTRVDVLTNVYLARVRCFAPDHIVAVGNKGVVLESDGKKWRTSRIPGADDTALGDIALFQGRVYAAAQQRLFVKNRNSWDEVRHGLPKDKTQFLRLAVGGDRLWAMGFKRLNSFDGIKWLAHPDSNNN